MGLLLGHNDSCLGEVTKHMAKHEELTEISFPTKLQQWPQTHVPTCCLGPQQRLLCRSSPRAHPKKCGTHIPKEHTLTYSSMPGAVTPCSCIHAGRWECTAVDRTQLPQHCGVELVCLKPCIIPVPHTLHQTLPAGPLAPAAAILTVLRATPLASLYRLISLSCCGRASSGVESSAGHQVRGGLQTPV